MENKEGKTVVLTDGEMPKTLWTIDYKKCTVCGECIDACLLKLLTIKNKKIVITSQTECSWCGDCTSVCASRAIVLT
nr:4Fe-4S dicluster domain-containing protein [Parabacteroides goldsteinii]